MNLQLAYRYIIFNSVKKWKLKKKKSKKKWNEYNDQDEKKK